MTDQNALIQPYVTHTATAIIRQNSNTAWTSAVEKFTAPEPSPTVIARTNRFKKFIDGLTKESKKSELNKFRLRQNFQISDVRDEANAALKAYNDHGSSRRKHFFRTLGRDFSNNATAIEALLAFLPSGEYTSILCGALVLVFNAAKRLAHLRDKILNCLGTLTCTVHGTEDFRQLYAGDKKLWESAESLYLALLDAVQDILAWLDESAWRHAIGALLKQDNYGTPLEDKIKTAVEIRVKEFHERLGYCQHERIQQIHIGVDKVARSVDSLQSDLQKSRATQQARDEDLTQLIVSMLQGQLCTFDWQLKSRQAWEEAVGQLARRNYDPVILMARGPPTINHSDLLSLLQVHTSVLEDDSLFAVQCGSSLSPERQSRAVSLFQHVRFRSWLQTSRCDILIVNGSDHQSAPSSTSPLTYAVGLLAQTLMSTQAAVPLVCICGRYASPEDPLEGAEGVMRLLIHQLLAFLGDSADLSSLDYNYVEAIKAGDIRYLRELFRSLLVSMVFIINRPYTIMCLVDGLSFLETTARKPGLEILVAFLQQLVLDTNDLGGFLVFKVLLIHPSRSQYAHDWFQTEDILTLPEDAGEDRHGYDLARMSTVSENLLSGTPSLHKSASEPHIRQA